MGLSKEKIYTHLEKTQDMPGLGRVRYLLSNRRGWIKEIVVKNRQMSILVEWGLGTRAWYPESALEHFDFV